MQEMCPVRIVYELCIQGVNHGGWSGHCHPNGNQHLSDVNYRTYTHANAYQGVVVEAGGALPESPKAKRAPSGVMTYNLPGAIAVPTIPYVPSEKR